MSKPHLSGGSQDAVLIAGVWCGLQADLAASFQNVAIRHLEERLRRAMAMCETGEHGIRTLTGTLHWCLALCRVLWRDGSVLWQATFSFISIML